MKHLLMILLAAFALTAAASGAQAESPLAGCRQMLLVTSDGWNDIHASLTLWERAQDGPWKQSGPAIPVVLGRSGLAWGAGLLPAQAQGPQKREGDGRAPAGVFRLGTAFGYEVRPAGALRMPYQPVDASWECVDDVAAPQYNRMLDTRTVPGKGWSSSEEMRRKDRLYFLGIVVEHNTASVTPGFGSCIFLHIWRDASSPTSGCTAMAERDMERVAAWLDPAAKPLLVQLPRQERVRLAPELGLP